MLSTIEPIDHPLESDTQSASRVADRAGNNSIHDHSPMTDRVTGTVKWFNPRKGYGFITRQGQPDIFVHYTQISADGFRLLEDGQLVEFELADGDKGLHACNVVAVESV